MLPVLALSFWLRSTILPGNNWMQILGAAAIVGPAYYSLAFFVALEREHRSVLASWIGRRWHPVLADGVAHG